MPQQSRSNYEKRKLSLISGEMTKRVALALKVPQKEIASNKTPRESDSKQKARDLNTLMEKIKEKIYKPETKHSEKIQLLTLVPNSWSRNDIVKYFHVTDYMVKSARSLLTTDGICSKPPTRKGRSLSDETKKITIDFYSDNENTRIMPGASDKVSISQNVYE